MDNFINTIWTRDNIDVLRGLNSQSVDLIYLDPPFNSKRLYYASANSKATGARFKDTWTWDDVNVDYSDILIADYYSIVKLVQIVQVSDASMAAYLTYMAQRLIEMKRVLKDTGTIYLHCDPTASHYLKVIMDIIFGINNFRNEIVWCYSSGGVSKKHFSKKHDIILCYSKNHKSCFFQPQYRPYSKGTLERGLTQYKKNLSENYELRKEGALQNDWWADITPLLSPTCKERSGYPTQKPLALLHRIINASSNIGDIILDPFCGGGTTCVAAQQFKRHWIGIDIEKKAVDILTERLSHDGLFSTFIHRTDIPVRTDQ